jgi:NAD(P)H dehydrogenase (quinone)
LLAAQVFSFDDIAALPSEVTGRTVTRTRVADDEFRKQLVVRGVPAEAAGQPLGIFAAVDPALATPLDREPVSLATVLRDQLSSNDA